MHSSTFKDQNYCAVAQFMWPNQNKVKLAYLLSTYKNQKKTGCRKVKKIMGASSRGWAESAPLVEIGLNNLPKLASPRPFGSGITELCNPINL